MELKKLEKPYIREIVGLKVELFHAVDDEKLRTIMVQEAYRMWGLARSIRIIPLPGLIKNEISPGEDILDAWRRIGNTDGQLRELIAQTPEWEPAAVGFC